jgi:hypothetical protein
MQERPPNRNLVGATVNAPGAESANALILIVVVFLILGILGYGGFAAALPWLLLMSPLLGFIIKAWPE